MGQGDDRGVYPTQRGSRGSVSRVFDDLCRDWRADCESRKRLFGDI